MFLNYIKTLLRTFKKNKLATIINFVGLSVAFTCAILLLIRVYHEFSYDSFYQDKERIFRVYNFGNAMDGDRLSTSLPFPLQEAIKSEQIGVQNATIIVSGGQGIRYKHKMIGLGTTLVGRDFLNVFSLPVLKGNQQQALDGMNSIVLSEKSAKSIFGTEDPLNKQVEVNIGGSWYPLIVSAVLKSLPDNSSLGFDMLARMELHPDYAKEKARWDSWQCNMYVKLNEGTSQKNVEESLRNLVQKYYAAQIEDVKKSGYKRDANGDYMGLRLLPVTQLHFNTAIGSGDAINKSFLYVLLLVACCILLIACFNFVNLNIGIAFTRTKEIGIRKCLGAKKKQVWLQVWSESAFNIILAVIVAVGLSLLLIKKFNQLFGASIKASLLANPIVILLLFVIVLVVSFIASGYPSTLMAQLKTTEVLKGKLSMKRKGGLRNSLIVLQFVIAIVLICATFIIYQQFQHLRKAPLGYNTDALISIPIKQADNAKQSIAKMRSLLGSQSSIVSVSGSTVNFGIGRDGSSNKQTMGFDFKGKIVRTNMMFADYDILKTLDIKPTQGRDFSTGYAADSNHNIIISESMLKQMDLQQPIGVSFYPDSTEAPLTIVGVMPDFQLYSMYNKREPLTILMDPVENPGYILIRTNTQNPATTMELVKKAYRQVEPGSDFDGSYVTENVDRWYESEKRLSKMFTVAAIVAIVLSCMGLFGMTFIVVAQRTKEIGVRKVLGASVTSVTTLVSKEFIKPVLIAILIAMPIALWVLNKWLQQFTYRVSIAWWVFAAAGLLAILIAVLTVSVQAMRAAYMNPVKSIRTE